MGHKSRPARSRLRRSKTGNLIALLGCPNNFVLRLFDAEFIFKESVFDEDFYDQTGQTDLGRDTKLVRPGPKPKQNVLEFGKGKARFEPYKKDRLKLLETKREVLRRS